MSARLALAVALALALVTGACNDPFAPKPVSDAGAPSASAGAASAPATSAAPQAGGSASSPAGGSAAPSTDASAQPLQLLRFTFTSSVKNKEPADELTAAEPGQRVWAHLAVRNRSGRARRIAMIFRVDGEERSTVDLPIETSWSYRTWGYNTLRAGDKAGELSVELRDDEGVLLARHTLPVQGAGAGAKAATKAGAKPAAKVGPKKAK